MPRIRTRGAFGAVLLASLVLGEPALAQPATPPPSTEATPPTDQPAADADASIVEARRRYAQGAEFYRRGRYAEAVAEFTEAYSRWSNPTILFALAQAYEGLSEVNRAIETYQHYLETAPATDARRGEVEAKITELERLLATVHIQCNVLASLYVDGERTAEAPGDVRIATGRHELELRAEGFVTASQTLILAGGTERTLSFHLEPIPVATTTQIVQVASEPFRFPRPVFYTGVGLTGAAVITWASLASITVVRANDYNDDLDRTNLERTRAREIARTSNVMLGMAGGLAAVTTVIGVFTEWGDDDDDEDDEDAAPAVTATIEPVVGGAIVGARWTR
jgi:tetratricopeptide (TPR) repeat protein